MRVRAGNAVEELVANCLADDGGAGIEQSLHAARILFRRRVRLQPDRIAAARRVGSQVVRHESRAVERGDQAHCFCAKYQSRILSPDQATTPSRDSSSLKVRCTWPMRCGTPEG